MHQLSSLTIRDGVFLGLFEGCAEGSGVQGSMRLTSFQSRAAFGRQRRTLGSRRARARAFWSPAAFASRAQSIHSGFDSSIHFGRSGIALAADAKTVGLRDFVVGEGAVGRSGPSCRRGRPGLGWIQEGCVPGAGRGPLGAPPGSIGAPRTPCGLFGEGEGSGPGPIKNTHLTRG